METADNASPRKNRPAFIFLLLHPVASLHHIYRVLRTRWILRQAGIVGGENARFLTRLAPRIENLGQIVVGDGLRIDCFSAPARIHCDPGAVIEFGSGVYVNSGALLFARKSIKVGDHTRFAEECYVCDTHFHALAPGEPAKTAPIVIGRNVWIGRRATLLPGITIGNHSVIGVGSIVSRDIPPRSVAAGTPARVLRTFECPDDWIRE
ncbi:acyltransferase [Opitutaceae bacterium EW11]|nr:acyltransferase [Opitutaceae bacterium EW11]